MASTLSSTAKDFVPRGAWAVFNTSENGKSFIIESQKLFWCRSKLKRMWADITTGVIDHVHSFDTITLPDGTHNHSMRQASLTGAVVQSLDELYDTATLAYPLFLECLRDLLRALGLPEAGPQSRLDIYTLKKRPRAAEKARDDYADRKFGPDISWLSDIVRSSIVCESQDEVLLVVNHLLDLKAKEARGEVDVTKPRLKLIRLKNRFMKPSPSGFRDFNMNLILVIPAVAADGDSPGNPELHHVCELQVHLKVLKDMGNEIGSHAVYQFFRTFFKGNMAAVEKRMKMLEALFGVDGDGGGAVTDPNDLDTGLSSEDFAKKRGLSLEDIVNKVIEEGDKERLDAAYDLFNLMAEYKAGALIMKAQIALHNPEDVEELIPMQRKLADMLMQQGELNEARQLYTTVLAEQTKLLEPELASTRITEGGGLATLLDGQGEWDGAKQLYTTVLAKQDAPVKKSKSLGPEHASTLITAGNLAILLMQQGKWDEARQLFTSVIATQTKLLGPEHADVLGTEGNLAILLKRQGEWDMAKELYMSVIAKKKKLLGAEHADTLISEGNLANLLYTKVLAMQNYEFDVGLADFQECVRSGIGADIYAVEDERDPRDDLDSEERFVARLLEPEAAAGFICEERIRTRIAEGSLESLLEQQREWDEAKQLYTKVLEKQTKLLGAEHASTLVTEGNLAEMLMQEGHIEKAKNIMQRVLETQLRVFGSDHPHTQYTLSNLRKVLKKLAKLCQLGYK